MSLSVRVGTIVLLGVSVTAMGCGGRTVGATYNNTPPAVCGDGVISGGEECDGAELGEQTCETLSVGQGLLRCSDQCTFDIAGCWDVLPVCGNYVQEPPEECDGLDLQGLTCFDVGFGLGDLGCTEDCRLDITYCDNPPPDCGNGALDPWEDCDGTLFGGASCQSLGFDGGDLDCTAMCIFDTIACTGPEICDDGVDNDLNGDTDCADASCLGDPACHTRQIYELFTANTPGDEWDLDHTTIHFLPDSTAPYGYTWSVTDGVTSYPSTPGTSPSPYVLTFPGVEWRVAMGFPSGHSFTLFGVSHPGFTVCANGSVTFGDGDPNAQESASALTAGLPRVAGHWDSLDVTSHGTVTYDRFSDRVAITFDQVDDPDSSGHVSFQIELFWSGEITITNLSHGSVDGLVGITEGGGNIGAPEVDFSAGM